MSEEFNNQNTENQQPQEMKEADIPQKHNSHIWKYILIIFVVFLGTFAAVYTVVDMNMHKLGMTPFLVTFQEAGKMFDDEAKFMEKSSPLPVKIEEKDNKYIVTVSLKNFDNNPENVNIETAKNGIKINGMMKKTKNGEVKESSFYQNVIFPNEIDEEKITKENKNNKIIITLPFEKEE